MNFSSLTETKEKLNKEGGAFPGPSGSLKFCPLEIAQKLWKENHSEVLRSESRMEQAQEYWGHPQGWNFCVMAKLIAASQI